MPVNETLVLLSDLERMKEALETAYHKSTAEDILNSYPKLAQKVMPSPLTKLLEGAVIKAGAYIDKAGEDDGES